MVPMLEEVLEMLTEDGIPNAVIGMAHRGRLNVIAHVVNAPYEEILSEFEAAHQRGEVGNGDDVTGDVKYHHGTSGTYTFADGKKSIDVVLTHNPSHLEAVDPVVEGRTRALQTDHTQGRTGNRRQSCRTDSHSRRCCIYRARNRFRSFQFAVAAGIYDRRYAAYHCEQSNRIHDRRPRFAARRATRPILQKASTCRSCT